MVGPNFLQEQTVYLLLADLVLLKFMLTLAKPGSGGRVSSKRTSILPIQQELLFTPKLTVLCIKQY